MEFMLKIADKLIVALIGILSALFSDYIIKRKREKKHNIWLGVNELKNGIDNKKRVDWGKSYSFEIHNQDIDDMLTKKVISTKLINYFNHQFDTREQAEKDGNELLQIIEKIK